MKVQLALLTVALVACVDLAPGDPWNPGPVGTIRADASLDALSASDAPVAARRKIVAIWGQSNAVGRASWMDATTLPDADTPLADVPLAQQIADASNPIPWSDLAIAPLAPRAGNPTQNIGIELSLGRVLDLRTPNGYALVKLAVGSSSLQADWRVDSPYPALPAGGPDLLAQAIAYTTARCADLDGDLVAIAWIQGETDATAPNFAAAYAANLENLIARARATFVDVPFVVTTLSPLSAAPYADDIRAAENVVYRDVAGVTLVDTSGLPLQLNQPHYTADSYVALGDRVAVAIP